MAVKEPYPVFVNVPVHSQQLCRLSTCSQNLSTQLAIRLFCVGAISIRSRHIDLPICRHSAASDLVRKVGGARRGRLFRCRRYDTRELLHFVAASWQSRCRSFRSCRPIRCTAIKTDDRSKIGWFRRTKIRVPSRDRCAVRVPYRLSY